MKRAVVRNAEPQLRSAAAATSYTVGAARFARACHRPALICILLFVISAAFQPHDAFGQSVAGSITITGSPLTMTIPSCFSQVKQDIAFSCTLGASNGSGSGYVFSKVSGSFGNSIPDVTSQGVVAGTPSGTASGTEMVKVCDSAGTCLTAPVVITPASLVSILLGPVDQSIQTSQTLQLTATGTWSDASTSNLSSTGTWHCSGTGYASITAAGLFTASGSGGTPGCTNAFNGVTSPSLTITVSTDNPTIQSSLTLINGQLSQPYSEGSAALGISAGQGVQLVASGGSGAPYTWTLTGGSLQGLSLSSGGKITGTPSGAGGTTAPVVQVCDSGANCVSGTFSLTIATLASIAVTPANPSIPVGGQQTLDATGTYTDSSTADVTNLVPAGSTPLSTATAYNCSATGSSCTINTPSSPTVPTGQGMIVVVREGADNSHPLKVVDSTDGTGATWTQIGVTNTSYGTAREFGIFQKVASAPTTNITCSTTAGSSAFRCILLVVPGMTTTLDQQAPSASLTNLQTQLASGSITTLNANDLIGYCVDIPQSYTFALPAGWTIPPNGIIGGTACGWQIVASTGTYSTTMSWTGGTVNAAGGIIFAMEGNAATGWQSSNANVATLTQNVALGVNVGSATIQAILGAISGSTTLNVTAPVTTQVNVQPNPATGTVGSGTTLTAKDQNGAAVAANWSSSSPSIATVPAGPSSSALVSCVAAGNATITATFNGVSGQDVITCSAAGTASLLPGCTVSEATNTPSCAAPAGWTITGSEGFGSGTTHMSSGLSGSIGTGQHHTGSYALGGLYAGDGHVIADWVHPSVFSPYTDLYVAYWDWEDSNAIIPQELYVGIVSNCSQGTCPSTYQDFGWDWQNTPATGSTSASMVAITDTLGTGGNSLFYYVSPLSINAGSWRQYEIWWHPNTVTGGVANQDGFVKLYVNGVLTQQKLNFAPNGLRGTGTGNQTPTMQNPDASAFIEVGGVITQFCDSGAVQRDTTFGSGGPCPTVQPTSAFHRYIDDVVVMKK